MRLRRSPMRVSSALAFLFLGPALARAQAPVPEAVANAAGTQQYHGIGAISAELRARIAQDAAAIQRYGDWMEGRRAAPLRWDTATVVWWLAESDNRAYVPLFVAFSSNPDDQIAQAAVYGLARHAGEPAARERLLRIASDSRSRERHSTLAVLLLHVGDRSAHGILARISAANLPQSVAGVVRDALSRGASNRKGMWPCPEMSAFRRGADGSHACQTP